MQQSIPDGRAAGSGLIAQHGQTWLDADSDTRGVAATDVDLGYNSRTSIAAKIKAIVRDEIGKTVA